MQTAADIVAAIRRGLQQLRPRRHLLSARFGDGTPSYSPRHTFDHRRGDGRAARQRYLARTCRRLRAARRSRDVMRAVKGARWSDGLGGHGGTGDVSRTLLVCWSLGDDRDDMVVKAYRGLYGNLASGIVTASPDSFVMNVIDWRRVC